MSLNLNPTTADPKLDPYTHEAEKTEVSPKEKIDGFKDIVKAAKFGMLTTRSKDGHMHSRCMAPAAYDAHRFVFLANNASHKFEEIETDSNVNISFLDPSTTNWASVTGTAKISQDKLLIKEHWSTFMKAYFTDLEDGVHKGDENDPRVAVIEVHPQEIRYWLATSSKIGQALKTAASVVTGNASPPGDLRLITKQEIDLVEGLNLRSK